VEITRVLIERGTKIGWVFGPQRSVYFIHAQDIVMRDNTAVAKHTIVARNTYVTNVRQHSRGYGEKREKSNCNASMDHLIPPLKVYSMAYLLMWPAPTSLGVAGNY